MIRIASAVMLPLLLISMLTLAFNIQLVRASGTIYIRADGSVDPPTAPIQHVGDVYTFTDDIYNMSIEVQRDNIKIDGGNHVLQCSGESRPFAGIYLPWRENVVITNVVISGGFIYGILLDHSSNSEISNNTIDNLDYGIELQWSDDNALQNNVVTNTYAAISLEFSSYNTLSRNRVTESFWGIELFFGTENKLRKNVMTANSYNFYAGGIQLEERIHDVDVTNTVDGKPIYYWVNRHNETVPLNAGCVFIVNSSKITVKNLKLENNVNGVNLAYTRDSLIENVTATGNFAGIALDWSDYNLITGNNVTHSYGAGIVLTLSNYNNVTSNIVQDTNGSGIWLEDTSYNRIVGNTVSYSRWMSPQEFDGAGVLVDDSDHCEVIGNNLTKNKHGVVVGATPSRHNLVTENEIVMNDFGLILYDARWNTIYHNNFIANKKGARAYYDTGGSTFDGGYPLSGNYWSDYAGVDLHEGPYQNETGNDGIGDTPYLIDENQQDNYPLIYPYGSIRNLNTNLTYFTIQSAINAPETLNGHTIFVRSGVYYEHVVVNKSLSLIGEHESTTIIDGNGTLVTILHITAGNVTIRGFTLQNSTPLHNLEGGGIYITNSNSINVRDSIIRKTHYGINLRNSTENTLIGNTIMENDVGIQFLDGNSNNSIIFHNNFLNNGLHTHIMGGASNYWDNGSEGNHWSDYEGADLDSDGIGDLPYIIDENQTDSYPLVGSWTREGKNVYVTLLIELAASFRNVASAGITMVNKTETGPNPPSDFKLAEQYYDIKTNANYSSNITIRILYDESDMTQQEEETLQLMQFNETSQEWVNITTHINMQNNTIYGETSTLSLFGIFFVTILGDVDRDLDVDIFDITIIAGAYGTKEGDERYNSLCDLNSDQHVDIFDIVAAAGNYGKSW